MQLKTTVKFKSLIRKVSQMENVYHEITFTEMIKPTKSQPEPQERDWHSTYYPHDIPTNLKEDLIGKETEILIKFYPVKRQVGEKEFTNINCHIHSITELKSSEK